MDVRLFVTKTAVLQIVFLRKRGEGRERHGAFAGTTRRSVGKQASWKNARLMGLEHKPPHGDVDHQAQHEEVHQRCGAPIADKRKGNAHHRHNTHYHSDINEYLPEKIKENSCTNQASKAVF